MSKDKFKAIWVSHSSISDYLKCPRAYYLKNVYRNPQTRRKITLMSPSLALGQAVHEVLESLSVLATSERFATPLTSLLELAWEKVSGLKGGFTSLDKETETKSRAISMLTRVQQHPGPLLNKAIKIKQELPYFWLSEEDNIILCGKIDWLEYLQDIDSVHVIDFKTGKSDENPDSLQLPIYQLLVTNCQIRPLAQASYWYIDRESAPRPVTLPTPLDSSAKVLNIAKKISLARKLNHFNCLQKDGCQACFPLESVVNGKAQFVGLNDFGQEVHVLV